MLNRCHEGLSAAISEYPDFAYQIFSANTPAG